MTVIVAACAAADTVANQAPVADAGGDRVAADDNDDGTLTVTLDGSASSDSDGTITSYVWTDYDGSEIATGETAQASLAMGIHDIKLTVTDNEGGTGSTVFRVWAIPTVDYWVDQGHASASDSNLGTADRPWRTVDHAVDSVGPGDVICVREGTYRESVSIGVKGTAADPITLMGYPGERVVVSGADVVTGWAQCTQAIARNNPNFQSIYYADLSWKPTRLIQDGEQLAVARTAGWYRCDGGTTTTLIDAEHLTQPDDTWNGATVFLIDKSLNNQYTRTVTDFDSATSTITVSSAWHGADTPQAGDDFYYLSNRAELIDGPGQWAAEDQGGGMWRVFCWADGGGDPDEHSMEASRRTSRVIAWTAGACYWTIDNLEVRHGVSHGLGGFGGTGAGDHITVQNCLIRDNDGYGIFGRWTDHGTYRRNLVTGNTHGISNVGSPNMTVEENEVACNAVDGLLVSGADVTVRRNYVHHHVLWGHPDSCQSYGGATGMVIEDNLMVGSAQILMMDGCETSVYRGNVLIGASASMINHHANDIDTTIENNTLMLARWALMLKRGDVYAIRNNLLMVGRAAPAWEADAEDTYASDYNLFWHGPGITSNPVTWPGCATFAQYVAASGQDTHSSYADPRFARAPRYFAALDTLGKQPEFTPTKVYMDAGDTAHFSVGDHVEINFDGIVRTVESVGADQVTFTPGSDYIVNDKAEMIVNWGETTDFSIDLTLQAGSPALGAGDDGKDAGSSIDLRAYMNGDFNGDGRRDVPAWPRSASVQLDITAALAAGEDWVYQNTQTTTQDRHRSTATVSLVSEASPGEVYDISIADDGPGGANVTLGTVTDNRPGDQTLRVEIVGGRVSGSTIGTGGAAYNVTITVEGTTSGQSDSAQVQLVLRTLGDVDGNGAVGAEDKQYLNQRLNNVATAYPDRGYDLNGSGGAPNAEDKQVMNQLLNNASLS